MDDFVLNVKQIMNYAQTVTAAPADGLLIQKGGVGGPYNFIAPADLLGSALTLGGFINCAPLTAGIAWSGSRLTSDGNSFTFFGGAVHVTSLVSAGDIFVNEEALATQIYVTELFDNIIENSVWTVNGKKGNVILDSDDILRAGAAPIRDAHFGGFNTSPTPWDTRSSSDQIATTAFVQNVIAAVLCSGSVVTSFNGRGGDIVLTGDDITLAGTAPGAMPMVNNPPFGDISNRIATTAFVDEGLMNLQQQIDSILLPPGGYAPLNSPQFTGIPTAPTATPGTTTGQLATTAFVQAAVTAGTAGVSSWNTRTGAVTLQATDVTAVGGALLASPSFTGTPQAPTAATATSTQQLATTAFVHAVAATIAAGVTSFNTRTGAVTLITADITGAGGAPIVSPTFTGIPAAPTAAPGTNTTQLATCAYVQAAVAAATAGVSSFNGRTGAVTLQFADVSAAGGAPISSPAFAGTPTTTTPNPGDNTTRIPTTAWVLSEIGTLSTGVASFNGRTGAVTLVTSDITGAGGAPLASPALTGVPTAPTPAQTVNDTTVATTAYVRAALAAAPGGVSSFNTRTGAITLLGADVSAAGGALLASPTFTGTPAAPTATSGTNTTQLATCAFVANAIGNVVSSFNGRNGAVTLSAADITGAGGALLASPTFTGTPNAPTPTAGTNNTQIATTAYVMAAIAVSGVTSFNTRTGAVTLSLADVTATNVLSNTALTGVPTAPTATAGTNTTQVATTAFVAAATAAPASGARVLLTSVDISTAVTLVNFFSGFDGTYDELELRMWDVLPASGVTLAFRFSADGSTFDSGNNYAYAYTYNSSGNVVGGGGGGSVSAMFAPSQIATPSTYTNYLIVRIRPVRANLMYEAGMVTAAPAYIWVFGGGVWIPATTAKGLQVFFTGNPNITRGSFRLYGMVK